MSRERQEERVGLSPIQRKACVVLALCALALILSILVAWVLPGKLGLFGGSKDPYDPEAFPLDTTLDCILPQASADDAYITASVFAGDQYAVSLQKDSRITLNQFVGQEGLKTAKALSTSCVNFASDSSTYTIVQAIPKMKARRVFVQLGSNDVDGTVSVESYIADYKQFLQSIRSAYSYCDIIAVAVPPVKQDSTDAAQIQTYIDQFNQALAAACSDLDVKYLNTAEVLKNSDGYAESTYFEGSGYSASGARVVLEYAKSHAYNTMDSRPDTSDIPQRASQSVGGNTAEPTATPEKLTASYEVEDATKGTLTGNGQTGVSSLEIEAASGTSVNVTAVAAEGFVFYKWSDGVTTATRYDNITKDISVKAMFNDARVELTLDKADTTIKKGEKLTINASVKLGGKNYDATNVQWSVNSEMEQNGSSFTFTGDNAGSYTIKAGIEINGTFSTAQLVVTVAADPTTVNISGSNTLTVGQSTTLTATVTNGNGDTVWGCEETSWRMTGNQVTFTANEAGTYHIHAVNNNVDAVFTVTVSPAPTQAPTPTPAPTPESTSTSTDQHAGE
ncbi:GDSL-type esterase/lipase family protein [Gemmiger formicilis]|uniref:GDSL-type esterase/lipase family protein n=1 Tax=Gemmiger formicilis TaxID=745368 RepID=UPI00210930E5|nr:GDSL-type esterase/lipase family protein [Gemmiger formicilis]MCQ5078431.1 GDSL-type esterase/lipase family protein [Gemmiger formicilis]MCQ5115134.1 GDSL-type esterase/lipase family protein [Gemmiger formicilis]